MATGVLLAGGASSRMGTDKLLMEIGSVQLIHRVSKPLAAACDDVVLVGAKRYRLPHNTRTVPDERPGRQGPLAGIEAGLAAAEHRYVFVAAGDMPFLPEGLVRHFLERVRGRAVLAVVPRYGGRVHPLCGAYDVGILPYVREALDAGTRAVRVFLERLERVEYVEDEELRRFGDPDLFLKNVNSPEDLARARRAAGR